MEKEYLVHLYNLDAQSGGLLGYFDSDASYIIEDNILQELIVCNKLIESYKHDIITASATVGTYKIDFNIYIQEGEGNKKRAGLFLLEKSKLGFIDKDLHTYVDSVVLENNGAFFDELKKRFHLYAIDESEGIDMNNQNLKNILARKNSSIKKYKALMPLLSSVDKAYVAKMMILLKGSGEHGKKFLELFRQRVSGIKLSKIDPAYWREVKLILDKMLIENKELFNDSIKIKMAQLQKDYVETFKNTKEPVIVAPPKPKKKKEKKKDGGGAKKAKPKKESSSSPQKPQQKTVGKEKNVAKEKSVAKIKGKDKPNEPFIKKKFEKPFEQKMETTVEDVATIKTEFFGFRVDNTVESSKTDDKDKSKKFPFGFKKPKQQDLGMER